MQTSTISLFPHVTSLLNQEDFEPNLTGQVGGGGPRITTWNWCRYLINHWFLSGLVHILRPILPLNSSVAQCKYSFPPAWVKKLMLNLLKRFCLICNIILLGLMNKVAYSFYHVYLIFILTKQSLAIRSFSQKLFQRKHRTIPD